MGQTCSTNFCRVPCRPGSRPVLLPSMFPPPEIFAIQHNVDVDILVWVSARQNTASWSEGRKRVIRASGETLTRGPVPTAAAERRRFRPVLGTQGVPSSPESSPPSSPSPSLVCPAAVPPAHIRSTASGSGFKCVRNVGAVGSAVSPSMGSSSGVTPAHHAAASRPIAESSSLYANSCSKVQAGEGH